MSSENGSRGGNSLSAIDLLGLTKQRKVARIDLAALGYEGVMYVRDLTSAENGKVTAARGKSGKARYYPDKSYELDMATLMEEAGPKFLMAAVVTDAQNGKLLEQMFAAEPDVEYLMMKESDLVQMADLWMKEVGTRHQVEAMLESMPNIITNAVVQRVRELSGTVEEREEKKDVS